MNHGDLLPKVKARDGADGEELLFDLVQAEPVSRDLGETLGAAGQVEKALRVQPPEVACFEASPELVALAEIRPGHGVAQHHIRTFVHHRPDALRLERRALIVDDRQAAARKRHADRPGLSSKIAMLQGCHARRRLRLSVHDEELAIALGRPVVDLHLDAGIEGPAGLGEHLDQIREEARAQARERGIVKWDAREMRSAYAADFRPEARRGDRNRSRGKVGPQPPDGTSRPRARKNSAAADGRFPCCARRSPALRRFGWRWRRSRPATAAHISDCRSSPRSKEGVATRD